MQYGEDYYSFVNGQYTSLGGTHLAAFKESAAKVIKPKTLFPYHYSNTVIDQVTMLLAGSGIDVRIRDYQ